MDLFLSRLQDGDHGFFKTFPKIKCTTVYPLRILLSHSFAWIDQASVQCMLRQQESYGNNGARLLLHTLTLTKLHVLEF